MPDEQLTETQSAETEQNQELYEATKIEEPSGESENEDQQENDTGRVYTQAELDSQMAKLRKKERRRYERQMASVQPSHIATQDGQREAPQEILPPANQVIRQEFYQIEQEKKIVALESQFNAAVEEARSKYEDYEDVISDVLPSVTETMLNALKLSPSSIDAMYHISKNDPQEVRRISRLSPEQQLVEVIKLGAKMSDTSSVPVTTNAPTPIDPVRPTGASAPITQDPSKMDYDKRVAQLREKYNRR